MKKPPQLAVFWADTLEPLSYRDRLDIVGERASVVSVTPHEVLLEVRNGHVRKVAIVSTGDPKGNAILKKHKVIP
jgi:hypothetical protein